MTGRAGGLSAVEVQTYERDGLVVPAYRLPSQQLSELRLAFEALIKANPNVPTQRLINVHMLSGGPVRGHQRFLDLATSPDLLDLVQSVLGPDLILWNSHLFAKSSQDNRAVPWHQDGRYWGAINPLRAVTLWVALDDATAENGAVRYFPGSHRLGARAHAATEDNALVLNHALEDKPTDFADTKVNALRAGQVSLHHPLLIHGSPANTSNARRAGLALRYMPSTSLFDRTLSQPDIKSNFATMPIILVRGVDRHGGNDFQTGHLPNWVGTA